ncbi:hypothetical protein T05_5800 [Trichinella murrelli]|uniref:Uncharacterized protein n=1 Tax=Trichinella murrelli TaxID=144512 RepID=A0A0V0T2U6_9BILA|nr:hypothetical protein T05_5800 [Trichinella murrelli]
MAWMYSEFDDEFDEFRILNNLFEKSGTLQQHFQFPGYKWH